MIYPTLSSLKVDKWSSYRSSIVAFLNVSTPVGFIKTLINKVPRDVNNYRNRQDVDKLGS